jgi:HEAT repeat protein
VEYWARVLRAPHRDDRVRAARSLGENRTPAAVPALLGALRDEDVEVRLTAIRALGSFGQRAQAAVPALEHALTDTAPAIRAEAAKALARIRTP